MIHPTALIGPQVKLGKDCHIGAYAVIEGKVTIGDHARIAPHVSIGQLAEHSTDKYELEPEYQCKGEIVIGDRVCIREFTTVNMPMATLTYIGNDCYIMARSHISHDCYLEDNVSISTNVCLGGWTRVMERANLGLACLTHQLTTIGAYAMIAANATLVKDVPPLSKFIPGKPLGFHDYAVKKFNLQADDAFLAKLNENWMKQRREGRDSY